MSIKVIIDYKNLKYFIIIKKLIRYQAYQSELLLEFNFVFSYIPRKKNQKAALLTHYLNNFLIHNINNC